MNALSGPLHGRANQSCFEFVKRIGTSDPAEVERFVRGELEAKRPVFGFGHAVLRAEDPRATVQFALGEEICPDDEYYRIIEFCAKLLQWYFQRTKNQQSKRKRRHRKWNLAKLCWTSGP